MWRNVLAGLILSTGVALVHADTPIQTAAPDHYTQSIEKWRADRVGGLTAPDGWLSLIGLEWLQDGANRVGSAADNDIVLQAGPAHLGVVTLDKSGQVHIKLAAESGATVDGKSVSEATLIDDAHVTGDASSHSAPPIFMSLTAKAAKHCVSKTARQRRVITSWVSIIFRSIRHGASLPIGCRSIRRMIYKWVR
jgi:hypothetical protein